MTTDESNFGTWLANKRMAKGFTQKNISEASNDRVSVSTLSNIERGMTATASLADSTLAAIADGLKVAPDEIFAAAGRQLPPWAMPGIYVPVPQPENNEDLILIQIADDLKATAERLAALVARRQSEQ